MKLNYHLNNCCLTKLFQGDRAHKSTQSNREPKTKQSTDTTESNLLNQWVLLGGYKNMGEREETERQLYQQNLPQQGWQLSKPGTWNTLHSQQIADRLEGDLSKHLWSKPLIVSSASFGFFQAAGLVFAGWLI